MENRLTKDICHIELWLGVRVCVFKKIKKQKSQKIMTIISIFFCFKTEILELFIIKRIHHLS